MTMNGEGVITGLRDVTDLKVSEDACGICEDRWKLAVDSARDGVWDWDTTTDEVFYSRRWKEMLGFRDSEIGNVRSEWEERIHPEDKPATMAALNAHLEGKSPFYESTYRLCCRDGTWKWIMARGGVVSRTETGRALRFVGVQRDITEYKIAEQARQEAERQYREIFERALEGIYRTSPEGKNLAANPALARILGYDSPQEVVATVTDSARQVWLDPNERAKFVHILEKRGVVRGYECQYKRKDGTPIWVSLNSRKVSGPDEKTLWYEGFIEDITERKRAEEELRLMRLKEHEATERLLTVAKCLPDVIFSMDLSGRFTYVSPSVERTHGWTADEVLRLSRRETTTREQAARTDLIVAEELEKAASSGYDRSRVITFESEQLRKDGTTFWAEISASLMWDNEKPVGFTGVARDITERKRAEAERQRLWSELAQVQKMESIGRLAGGVAHDFNNLLTVINGYSRMALAKLREGDPLRHQIQEIDKAGQRAAGLTHQLLAFGRKQILQPRLLDLNHLVESMQSMLQRLVGEDVEVCFRRSRENVNVLADLHQLEQVIMNLAVNARDAMPRGGRFLIVTAVVERGDRGGESHPDTRSIPYAMLMVSDTGTGMNEATLQRIFEPFFTTKGTGQGTGLGLSIVHGIIEQSGGFIEVGSEPDRGTVFRIYLPLAASAMPAADKPATASELRGSETILVVEDQAEVRGLIVEMLTDYGYRVIQAATAGEALLICEQTREHPIQMVLTDLVMPHMNGRELVSRLAKSWPGIKALFMSGYAGRVMDQVLEDGAQFIQKPFEPGELAEKVRKVLGNPDPSAGRSRPPADFRQTL